MEPNSQHCCGQCESEGCDGTIRYCSCHMPNDAPTAASTGTPAPCTKKHNEYGHCVSEPGESAEHEFSDCCSRNIELNLENAALRAQLQERERLDAQTEDDLTKEVFELRAKLAESDTRIQRLREELRYCSKCNLRRYFIGGVCEVCKQPAPSEPGESAEQCNCDMAICESCGPRIATRVVKSPEPMSAKEWMAYNMPGIPFSSSTMEAYANYYGAYRVEALRAQLQERERELEQRERMIRTLNVELAERDTRIHRIEQWCEESCSEEATLDETEALMRIWQLVRGDTEDSK